MGQSNPAPSFDKAPWWRAVVGMAIFVTVFSLPLASGMLRGLVRSLSPEMLARWELWAGVGWGVVILMAVAPWLWATRKGLVRFLKGLLASPNPAPAPLPSHGPGEPDGPPSKVPLDLIGPPARIEIKPAPEIAKAVGAHLTALGVPECTVLRHYQSPFMQAVDIRPPETVKVAQVRKLAEDLAYRLGVHSVSIEPVPGTPGVLQVQVAGERKGSIPPRVVIDSKAYRQTGGLPLCIGLDPAGRVIITDLTRLPHLLVAGTTGSGKSFLLRQLLLSLLYRLGPEDLRLLLIDPKQVELALFRRLPHLDRPVITAPAGAGAALVEMVEEMERRYALFERSEVTNIQAYNRQAEQRLPYVVVVIDELADIIADSKARDSIETGIQRLGQKARAAGIHLIVATQRPSVDVITGIIKANIPARVALRVASVHDSRTILDVGGAEELRGEGDLIFWHEARQVRGQSTNVTDDLARNVVLWYQASFPAVPQAAQSRASADPPPPSRDELELRWAREYALREGVISRRIVEQGLGIASARAAAVVKVLESEGWLLPGKGNKPRRVVFDEEDRKRRLVDLQGPSGKEVDSVSRSRDSDFKREVQ